MTSEADSAISTTFQPPFAWWLNVTDADSALSTAIHRPFTLCLNVVFVFQTIFFALLLYVLSMSANRTALTAYRWCLLANVVSVYGFQLVIFLSKPILAGQYFVSFGLADNIHSKALLVCLFGMILFGAAHIVAMQFCIYYQYVSVSSARGLVSSDLLDRIYASKGRFFTCYFLVTVVTGLAFAGSFATCNYWIDARGIMLFEMPLRPAFLDTADAVLRLRMSVAVKCFVVFTFLLLLGSFTMLMTYCCLKIYIMVYRSGGYRSERTSRMQLTLFKSLVAQTVCLVACYGLPFSLIVYVKLFGSAYGYSMIVLLHYLMYVYAPLNYAMIFVFVKQFRTELLRLADCGQYTARTGVGIHFVSMTL